MGLGFKVAWQELSVLPCAMWQTSISIPRAVAEGQHIHPSWSQKNHTTVKQIAQEKIAGGGLLPCSLLCLKQRQLCLQECLPLDDYTIEQGIKHQSHSHGRYSSPPPQKSHREGHHLYPEQYLVSTVFWPS